MEHDRGNVEFLGRIETTQAGCRIPPNQPVGSDYPAGAVAVVEHQEVIAIVIKLVDIAPSACHFRQWLGAEPLIKDAIPQRLRGFDICRSFCQPHLQGAGPDIDDRRMQSRCRWQRRLKRRD